MLESFSFAATPRVIFGEGKIDQLPILVKPFGKKMLLVTGGSSLQSSPVWSQILDSLKRGGLSVDIVSISREPSPGDIDKVVGQYHDKNIDCVVGIGGGSVLDAGKAISAMLPLNEPVKDYLEGVGTKVHSGIKVPFIAVPTTSGTGSEGTKNAVISEVGQEGFKKSLRHDQFVPNIALLDPELTITTPKQLTANSGMDAFTQLLESYLSTKANIMTDSLAIKGLSCVRDFLERAVIDGSDLEARKGMAYAAFASGLTLANAGLGTVHGMASAIGGYFDMPHGAICGSLMSEANKITVFNLKKQFPDGHWALQKYAKVGRMFSQKAHKPDNYHVEFLLKQIDRWTEEFEIPGFSKFGLTESNFDKIVAASGNKNNPIELTEQEMRQVLASRL